MVLKLFYLPPVSFPRSEYPLRWGGGYPLLNELQFDWYVTFEHSMSSCYQQLFILSS